MYDTVTSDTEEVSPRRREMIIGIVDIGIDVGAERVRCRGRK